MATRRRRWRLGLGVGRALRRGRWLGVLWWDRPPTNLLVLTLAFKTFFFVMTSVILMNMLIAMMTVRRRPFRRRIREI